MEGRREEEEMRERDKGKEKENIKGRKRLSAMPRFCYYDKITHVSFTATAESCCLFSRIYLDHQRISNVAYLRCIRIRTFCGGCSVMS